MQARVDEMFRRRTLEQLVADIPGDTDGVRWARSCTGPVVDKDVPNMSCYGCNQPLSFVKEHASRRNGIEHTVRSYYRHRGSRTLQCSSETVLHKAAKHALCVHGYLFKFSYPCGVCRAPIRIDVCSGENCTFDDEVSWKQYKLDVGVSRGEKLCGAIEVLVTHKSAAEKLGDLTDDDIAWCEVHAHRVMGALEDGTFDVEVARCAAVLCDQCAEGEKERVIRGLESQRRRSEDDAAVLRQKRCRIVEQATEQWKQMKANDTHDVEQRQWIALTQCVYAAVAAKAAELGIGVDDASAHVNAILDGEVVMQFGKHRGRTLSEIQENDWPYLLWLAGYDFGRMDDRGRASRRVCGTGTMYITDEVEQEAKKLVRGQCFECQGEVRGEGWRTWCRRCFAQLRRTSQ